MVVARILRKFNEKTGFSLRNSFVQWLVFSFLFFPLKSTDKRIKLFEFELVFDSLKARSRLICEEYYLIICEELWVSLIRLVVFGMGNAR